MGSIFSVYDIRGRAADSLSTEYVWNVGKAFAEWLPEDGAIALVKHPDADQTTTHAFVEGVLLQGRNVLDAGTGDQQGVIALLRDGQAVGGAIITHDSLQNIEVITLLNAQGMGITAESGLTEIAELVEAGNFVPAAQKGEVRQAA